MKQQSLNNSIMSNGSKVRNMSNEEKQRIANKAKTLSKFKGLLKKQLQTASNVQKGSENSIILKRLIKFFFYNSQQNKVNLKDGYFCSRRDPNYQKPKQDMDQVVPLQTQVILYGIDFIKQKQIQTIYKCKQSWIIDSSHIMLKYSDPLQALDALIKNQRQNVKQNLTKLDPENQQVTRKWMQMKPYNSSGFQRRLVARYATTKEVNLKNDEKRTRDIIEHKAQKQFDRKLRESAQIQARFQERQEKLIIQRQNNRENGNRFNHLNNQKEYPIQKNYRNQKRERSRQKHQKQSKFSKDDDNISVISKTSSIGSMLGRMDNMNIQQDNDISFILGDHDHEFEQELIDRLNLSQEIPKRSELSYSLTQNMPGPNLNQTSKSFIKANGSFNYSQYMKEQEAEQQRKRLEERSVIVIDDDN